MTRTALLIRCDADEADRIRAEARKADCTISEYILQAVAVNDHAPLNSFAAHRYIRRSANAPVPRTAILVRCDVAEAEQIREAARRHAVPINAFVLHALKSTWNAPNARRQ
jgi:uncharacterized protein (DUF1778 family)